MPAVGRSLIREAFQDSAYRCFNMKKLQHFKKKKKKGESLSKLYES